jgi:hypothetical protein
MVVSVILGYRDTARWLMDITIQRLGVFPFALRAVIILLLAVLILEKLKLNVVNFTPGNFVGHGVTPL